MSTLLREHPAQLVLGAILIAEEFAMKNHQATFASICHDAVVWATDTRDVLREIASDACYGVDLVKDVAADGKITPGEANTIAALFGEIEVESREGRIV